MQKWNISKYRSQRVDEKSDFIRLITFTSKGIVIRMSKMAYLMFFLLNTQKNTRPSLGKIFKYNWKFLFGPLMKCYGLCSSDLPLTNCQHLKIRDFNSLLLTQHLIFLLLFIYLLFFFFDISTHNIARTVTSKTY